MDFERLTREYPELEHAVRELVKSHRAARALTPPVPGHDSTGIGPAQTREISARRGETILDENVRFTAYRPRRCSPEQWNRLLVFAHLSDRRETKGAPDPVVEARRQETVILGEEASESPDSTLDSRQPISRSTLLTLVPDVAGVEFDPPRVGFRWQETVHGEALRLRPHPSLMGQSARGRLTIYLGGIIVAEVPLSLPVESDADETIDPSAPASAQRFRRIFASFARRDRDVASHVAQVSRALGDGVVSGSPAEFDASAAGRIRGSDVFQLFWSSHAMECQPVLDEMNYAMALSRGEFIRPTYWQEPLAEREEQDLPPATLRQMGFQKLPPLLLAGPHLDEDEEQGGGTLKMFESGLEDLVHDALLRTMRPRLVLAYETLRRVEPISFPDGTVSPGFVIGRAAKSRNLHCNLEHRTVAYRHARIYFDGVHFFVEHLGGKNGTSVGTELLAPKAPRQIRSGQHLRFGSVDSLFVVDCDAEGKVIDPGQYRRALDILVRDGGLTRAQRRRAEEQIGNEQNVGEALLLAGVISVEDWVDALDRAETGLDVGFRIDPDGVAAKVLLIVLFIMVLGVVFYFWNPAWLPLGDWVG